MNSLLGTAGPFACGVATGEVFVVPFGDLSIVRSS